VVHYASIKTHFPADRPDLITRAASVHATTHRRLAHGSVPRERQLVRDWL